MKKLFTLIAAALMVVGAYAKETVLWEGEAVANGWKDQPYVLTDGGSDLKGASAAVGDVVRFYATAESDGWQIQLIEGHWGSKYGVYAGSALTDEKTGEPVNNQIVDLNTVGYFEVTLTEDMLTAAYKSQGWGGVFLLNGDGNVKCTKVTLISSVETTSTALWEGESNFGNWADGVSVDASKFANAKAGDKIKYTYTTTKNEAQPWYQFMTIFAGTKESLTSIPDLNEYDCASVAFGSTSFVYELNEADAAKLKETGMFINGKDVVVTKVELIQVASAAGVSAVKIAAANDDAALYNLAGQKVAKNYKGIVVKNGKKFVNK